ncbi:Carboxylesterase NlhH [Maioricimonas rarisocia]|uniref:Carboxylesterase NlhH n=1 Tax=Maioricimonas rarisocia TaxID=2528026 RepID=A0A517ZGA5_9PLAN|nr:alpha/beta hydrolase fold domain-containing protein [Maioricimonas rarisocia]QDU41523.1 Carboxylesterase NlhH [Maioricimonas rarisocia]
MRSAVLATSALLFVISANAFAQPASSFDRLDRNSDGQITKEELPERIRGNFDRVDTDGDGAISRKEHERFLARNRNRNQQTGRRTIPLPDSVQLTADISYADTDHARQRLDLLLPKERTTDKPLPVVVFIHGGGWRNGDKLAGRRQVARFVGTGEFAGASIGYRLSGDATWPAQIHDCKAAIRWLRANAAEHGLDPERIGVMGSSAGGHLVAMLGTSGDVEDLEGDLGPHTGVSSRVSCVIDLYGPTDFLTMNLRPGAFDHESPSSPESLLIGGPIREHPDRVRHASPLTYVTEDDPPFLIIHGTDDRLVLIEQSQLLQTALKEADVDVLMIPVTGGGHGGFRNPELDERMLAFFQRHLQGKDVEISASPVEQGAARRP